jgi:polysaccharide export outer membrane protein
VDPVVTVSVVEYRSRPISVVGAVRAPVTFQAEGVVTLLDAISRAQGLAENAGPEILISHSQRVPNGDPVSVIRRVPVKALIGGTDPELNLRLEGGEEIRVPEAGKVFVVGNVKKPGSFPITDGEQTSVMKVLAMAEGALPYSDKMAYIYRAEGGSGGKAQIEIELKKIMDRKAPDVPVLPDDVLYIPENAGRRGRNEMLKESAMLGGGIAAALIMALMR